MQVNKQGQAYRPGVVVRLDGQRFGLLTVMHREGSAEGFALWRCRCDCGREIVVASSRLRQGRKNCCPSDEHKSERRISLTVEYKPEYHSWRNMQKRCFDPKNQAYRYYGARGITVCERWKSFRNFLLDMGRKPHPRFTIERENVDGGYEPSNCKWIARSEQGRNKRNSVFVTYAGRRMLLIDAIDDMGLSRGLVQNRLRAGWTLAQALSLPPLPSGRTRGTKNKKPVAICNTPVLEASPDETAKDF